MRRAPLAALAVAAAWLGGCQPGFAPLSLVTAPRVVAVQSDPAEQSPGSGVTLRAFVVGPDGAETPPLAWSLCRTPTPATENDAVDPSCLAADGTTALGTTPAALPVTMPGDACRLFGPDAPPPMAGQPPPEPRAPDVTGGYYQPVRVVLGDAATIAPVRVRCALAGASMDVAAAFAARYTPNINPTLTPLSATVDGQPVALDALPAGRDVTFTVGWSEGSPETYPVLDPQAQVLVDHREAMTVSWYVTAGTLAAERSGRGEDDAALTTDDVWTAPATPGPAHLYVVLRDSRGGVDFAAYDLAVR